MGYKERKLREIQSIEGIEEAVKDVHVKIQAAIQAQLRLHKLLGESCSPATLLGAMFTIAAQDLTETAERQIEDAE